MPEAKEDWAKFYGYFPHPIDIDLGVTRRNIPGTSSYVTMYKQMPGLYLNAQGGVVPDEMAKAAGFPIEEHRHVARIERSASDAATAARAEYEERTKEARREADRAMAAAGQSGPFVLNAEVRPPVEFTTRNAGGDPRGTEHYVMDHHGGGKWNVHERDDGADGGLGDMMATALSQDDAIAKLVELESALAGD